MKIINQLKVRTFLESISQYPTADNIVIAKYYIYCSLASIIEVMMILILYLNIINFWAALVVTYLTRRVLGIFNLNLFYVCFIQFFKNCPELMECIENKNYWNNNVK